MRTCTTPSRCCRAVFLPISLAGGSEDLDCFIPALLLQSQRYCIKFLLCCSGFALARAREHFLQCSQDIVITHVISQQGSTVNWQVPCFIHR